MTHLVALEATPIITLSEITFEKVNMVESLLTLTSR